MIDVLGEITKLRIQRGWTEYELAKNSGVPQSTISSWYRKNQMPTIQNLHKICVGLGVTLSQFFAEDSDAAPLSRQQREVLEAWSALNERQRRCILELLKNMRF